MLTIALAKRLAALATKAAADRLLEKTA